MPEAVEPFLPGVTGPWARIGAVMGMGGRWCGSSLLVWCSSGQVVMAGRAGRLLTPSVLLSAWSMSVRCRSEVWDRYRRSPYCHSSLLWQDGADQTGDGLAVGEDLDDVGAALERIGTPVRMRALVGVPGDQRLHWHPQPDPASLRRYCHILYPTRHCKTKSGFRLVTGWRSCR